MLTDAGVEPRGRAQEPTSYSNRAARQQDPGPIAPIASSSLPER